MFAKIRNYISEVKNEMKSVSWPTRKELVTSTTIVIISTALLSLFIGLVDLALSTIVNMLLK